jgi:POT family proton-dependent oligopeptide transporter
VRFYSVLHLPNQLLTDAPALSADPLLVWNYGVMGVLAAVTAVLVWFSVRGLDAKEDELNNLAEGHVEAKH